MLYKSGINNEPWLTTFFVYIALGVFDQYFQTYSFLELKLYIVNKSDVPGLSLTYLTARPNFVKLLFVLIHGPDVR